MEALVCLKILLTKRVRDRRTAVDEHIPFNSWAGILIPIQPSWEVEPNGQ